MDVVNNSAVPGKSGLPGPRTLLSNAWQLFRERWKILLGLGLIPAALLLVAGAGGFATAFALPQEIGVGVGAGVFLAAMIFIAVLGIAVGAAQTFVVGTEQRVRFGEAFRWGMSRFFPMLGVGTLSGLLGAVFVLPGILIIGIAGAAVGFGFGAAGLSESPQSNIMLFLLAIGGILALAVALVFLFVRLMFVYSLIALKESTVFGGFKESWRLTKGRFWALFGRGIVAVLLSLVVSLVFNLLSAPFAAMGDAGEIVSGMLSALVQLIISAYLLTYFVLLFRWTQHAAGATPVAAAAPPVPPTA